jgi:hypothetical protein
MAKHGPFLPFIPELLDLVASVSPLEVMAGAAAPAMKILSIA